MHSEILYQNTKKKKKKKEEEAMKKDKIYFQIMNVRGLLKAFLIR
jgi:hypothetical protein